MAHSDPSNFIVGPEPSKNTKFRERYTLSKMSQEKNESFNDFYARIQSQSKTCEFGDAFDGQLLDRIIAGIQNDVVREEFLSDADLTLGKAIQVCCKREQPKKNV